MRLTAATNVVFEVNIVNFETAYKESLKRTNSSLKLYGMFSSNVSTLEESESRKITISQSHPLLLLPPAGSAIRKMVDAVSVDRVRRSKFVKFLFVWRLDKQHLVPAGLALIASRNLATARGEVVIVEE